MDARIPLKDFKAMPVSSGDTWRVNFRRKQQRNGTSADWMVPVSYDPAAYGTLIFK
jgi:hypothetical protein